MVVSFLAGVALTVLVMRLLSRRSGTSRVTAPGDAGIEESITAFGEQLENLVFDPGAPGHTEAMVADYRAALEAYDKAKAIPEDRPNREARVAAALGKGRAALVRLDARLGHRPIPLDAIEDDLAPAPEVRASEDRHLTAGRKPGEYEILLDRPEPGGYAIADVTYRGDANFFVNPVTRTDGTFETGQTIVNAQRTYHGRHLVDPSITHFKVKLTGESCDWSVRLLPVSAALPLSGERHGRDFEEVLSYDGSRTRVTVQVRTTGTWRLSFERPGRRGGTDWIHGLGDGMKELNVPGSGWLVVQVPDGGSWSLQLPS
ncbi:hypothetical protein [Actinomadura sp. DC4]|uniref:hypothetical protein n=1 Tax=Actinomadura sp. DC4 TaxID=3055069 RepID=UPI0025B1DDE6|nr:hypothetical protein [Actinomadura sp. DC4]MDN3354229.1 hypothetical protein [Actinomadura sp. DC4]